MLLGRNFDVFNWKKQNYARTSERIFVVWETWKERNTRVFEGRARKPEEAWTRIYAHIKETLGLRKWDGQALKAGPEETRILRNWEITSIPKYLGTLRTRPKENESLDTWEPPPKDMFKMNFDGASKGNPGPTGYGGAIRNAEGRTMGIFWGYIGENTNNIVELKGPLAGLTTAINNGWLPIILEGDSRLFLQMVSKILHGKSANKVAENWKMIHTLEQISEIIREHSEVQIHHVRRKANKLADLLANQGIKQKSEWHFQMWDSQMEAALRKQCSQVLE